MKPMPPGLFSIILNLVYIFLVSNLLFCNRYFPMYKPKIPKIFTLPFIYLYQISLLQVTMKGLITTYRVGCKCLIASVGAYIGDLGVSPTRFIPWFLTEGNTYLYFAASPFPLQGKNQRKLKKWHRPALVKFMATSHYAYYTFKMPGPMGVISVISDQKDAIIYMDKQYRMRSQRKLVKQQLLPRQRIARSPTGHLASFPGSVPLWSVAHLSRSRQKALPARGPRPLHLQQRRCGEGGWH